MSIRLTWIIDTALKASDLPNAIGGYKSHVTVPAVDLYYNNPAINGATYTLFTRASCSYGLWSEIYVPTDGNGASALQTLATDNVGAVAAGRVYILGHLDVMNFTAINGAVLATNGSAPLYDTRYLIYPITPAWKLYRV